MQNYIEINKNSWNKRTEVHLKSEFYNLDGFIKGKSSLNAIELELLGNISGKKILHLQCHFGQDTISLARLGAIVTGVDLSDKAIEAANELVEKTGTTATFICCNIYDLPKYLNETFDIVFTSYGTIGWLPDIEKWAKIVSQYLKPGGYFVFAEFHPVIWMYDNDFTYIQYNYFIDTPIIETQTGTYADTNANIEVKDITWNHSISEVVNSLIINNLQLISLNEYNYSPYNCFNNTEEFEPGKFRIKNFGNKVPLVYALKCHKPLC